MSLALNTLCVSSLSQCASCSGSNEQPPSKAVKRAAFTQPSIATVYGGEREVRLHACFDLNGNIRMPGHTAGDSWEGTEAQSCHGENEAALEDLELRSQENQHCISQGR